MLSNVKWAGLAPLVAVVGEDTAAGSAAHARCYSMATSEGAKWRAIPRGLSPQWQAAQIFIQWSRERVGEHLLVLMHA
ncbi:hypothetical protein FV233_26540 [Methylobacterium sp. WL7]|nr:hypothetical protein FV233_26540 [Methylobacterium sp. WL7]